MATAPAFANEEEQSLFQEQTRLFNFLKHYDLHQYYSKFIDSGVKRLSHLKDVAVDDASLDVIGLTRPERMRLRKKVKDNVESFGKFKKWILGKSSKFDDPAPEVVPPGQDPGSARPRTAAVIPKDQIHLGEKIGEGAHGSVHRGVWADVHGSVSVAVKRLYGRQEVQTQFIKEANSMCSLDHSHIIRLYGIVLSEPLMLIEELARLGNLHSFLHNNGKRLTVRLFHTYATQIADAMRYLEKNRIVHRDLATRNILLVQEDAVKLSDFGMARVLDEQSDVYNLSNLGARIPVAWTAVEALTRAKFSTASDVWSYGVVLWEIYSLGETPFEGLSPVEIRDMLLQGERLGRPERCPTEMYTLLKSCWNLNPHDRPNFGSLCQRLQSCSPIVVRALKAHDVANDTAYLSFKTGELIYVIDKPKPEWIFGMRADGSIGQLSSDNVTNVVAALDDIKAKVSSGKVKAANLSISDPTSVDHMMHWGRDGTKWQTNEQEVGLLGRHSPLRGSPMTSPKQNGRTSPNPVSPKPYLQLGSTQSPSPTGGRESPLLAQATSPPTTSHMTTAMESSGHSTARHSVSQPTEPGLGYEISYGDTKFMGIQRYVTNRESYSSDNDQNSPQHDTEDSQLRPQQLQSQVSEDNSYISFGRANLPDPDVVQRHSQIEPHEPMADSSQPEEGYITMGSFSVRAKLQHGYQNLPSNVPASGSQYQDSGYAVPRTVASVVSGVANERRGSILDDDMSTSATGLPEPLQPTETSPPNTEEALEPRSVRFFSTTNRSPSANRQSSHSNRDPYRSRPVVPTRSNSSKEKWVLPSPAGDRPTMEDPQYPVPKPRQSVRIDQQQTSAATLSPHPQATPKVVETGFTSSGRVGVYGNPAFDCIRSDSEFTDSDSRTVRNALQKYNNDPEKAKEYIRVRKLLDMGIPNINEADCLRALSHCQQKTDRAADWLLQISDDIEERAQ